MIERLSTRVNANGYACQVEIDHESRIFKCGYFIFRRNCYESLTVGKRELKQYIERLIANGYTRI